jgi:glycosyltransferase involved in cell wall biosynthesis
MNNKIKTALVIERADTLLGGAERSALELAIELARQNVDITIIAAKANNDFQKKLQNQTSENQAINKNIKLHTLNCTRAKRTSIKKIDTAVSEYVTRNDFDIVHSLLPIQCAHIYQPRGGSYKQAMIQNARSYASPARKIFKIMTHRANINRTALLQAEKKLCLNTNTIIAALSNYVKQHFLRQYPLDESRVKVIHNGVKINRPDSQAARKKRTEIMTKLGRTTTDAPVIFLFAATNFRLKGFAPLIKALSAAQKNTQKTLLLVAVGSKKIAKQQLLATKLGINTNTLFLPLQKDLTETIAACDIGILPTYYDPASRFILETLAMKKPAITTDCNGAAEMMKNERHGFIVDDPENTGKLTQAILILADDEKRQIIKNAIADDNLENIISITRHVSELIDLYKYIIKERK